MDPKKAKAVYKAQDDILKSLDELKDFPFVLSGGTALARFYFHHRFSEDLDFFFEGTDFSFAKVEQIIRHLRKKGLTCELTGTSDEPGHLKAVSYVLGVHYPVKADFLEDPFSGMWLSHRRKTESGLSFRVDHPDQIYYRKIFSILEQWHRTKSVGRVKDLVDLYYLDRDHRPLDETLRMYRKEHIPVDEEKLILAMGHLKSNGLKKGLKEMGNALDAAKMLTVFRRRADNLLRKRGSK